MNKSEAIACLYIQMSHIDKAQFEKTDMNTKGEPAYLDQDFMDEWGLSIEDLHKGLISDFFEASDWVESNLDKDAKNKLYNLLYRSAVASLTAKQMNLDLLQRDWNITNPHPPLQP
jgi:hypothetical protein